MAAANTSPRQIKTDPDADSQDAEDVPNDDTYNHAIANRFTVNVITNDGTLSNMTRGALIGVLCGIALGDTAGAVTLCICGLVAGLFFNQSAMLAIIAGVISGISYSIYVAGFDAISLYVFNIAGGITFFLPI